MSTKKGLVFYYDWLDQLLKLRDKELRAVLTAIVLYHKEDSAPPALSGMADMALGFILPQIDRMKKKAEDGKLGGRPRKEDYPSDECNMPNALRRERNNKPNKDSTLNEEDELLLAALERQRRQKAAREREWAVGKSI